MSNSPIIFGPLGPTAIQTGGIILPGSTSGTLQVQPAAATTTYAVTMPAAQGTGALTNNGSGVLSWTPSSTPTIVSARYYNASVGVSTGGFSPIPFNTLNFDTNSAYNTSTGVYTVPSAGKYSIYAKILVTATYSNGSYVAVSIFINGSEYATNYIYITGSASVGMDVFVSDLANLNINDQVTIEAVANATSPTILSSTTRNFFSIAKIGT